jgi:hypothetical protein
LVAERLGTAAVQSNEVTGSRENVLSLLNARISLSYRLLTNDALPRATIDLRSRAITSGFHWMHQHPCDGYHVARFFLTPGPIPGARGKNSGA